MHTLSTIQHLVLLSVIIFYAIYLLITVKIKSVLRKILYGRRKNEGHKKNGAVLLHDIMVM